MCLPACNEIYISLSQLPQEDKKPGNGAPAAAPLVGILKNGNVTPTTPDTPTTAATKNGDIVAARIEEEDEEEQQQHEQETSKEATGTEQQQQQQLLNLNATDAAHPTDAVADTNGASCKLLKSTSNFVPAIRLPQPLCLLLVPLPLCLLWLPLPLPHLFPLPPPPT